VVPPQAGKKELCPEANDKIGLEHPKSQAIVMLAVIIELALLDFFD
jgi:hypothetical protein